MDTERYVGLKIKTLYQLIKRELERETSGAGASKELTENQRRIIGLVLSSEGDVYQRDVEKHLGVRRSTATGILQLMERQGLLHRENATGDRRLKRIVLTQRAVELYRRASVDIEYLEAIITRGLTSEEVNSFLSVSDRISRNLGSYR